jgi:hypothetical protein
METLFNMGAIMNSGKDSYQLHYQKEHSSNGLMMLTPEGEWCISLIKINTAFIMTYA